MNPFGRYSVRYRNALHWTIAGLPRYLVQCQWEELNLPCIAVPPSGTSRLLAVGGSGEHCHCHWGRCVDLGIDAGDEIGEG